MNDYAGSRTLLCRFDGIQASEETLFCPQCGRKLPWLRPGETIDGAAVIGDGPEREDMFSFVFLTNRQLVVREYFPDDPSGMKSNFSHSCPKQVLAL